LYVTILFSSNKLLKLKYIHHYLFLKFLTKKSQCILWAGKYGNSLCHSQKLCITCIMLSLTHIRARVHTHTHTHTHTIFVFFIIFKQQTVTFGIYSISWMVFVVELQCVYFTLEL